MFLRFLKVSFDHLFDNLESGKLIKVFEKRLEKVLNFGSKNLYEPRKAKRLILTDSLEAEPVISLSLRLVSCNNLSLLEELPIVVTSLVRFEEGPQQSDVYYGDRNYNS